MVRSDVKWFVGLLTAVCVALAGQAELIGEPWRHYIAVAGIVGTAVCGYLMTPNGSTKD